ncbi:hypothetical protein BKA93DRAFT_818670 [Sparassis latifolia]
MAYYAVRFYFTFAGAPTSSNVSWIGSLHLFLLFSVGLPAGKLFDSGYFHATTVFGTVFYVFSIFMLSLADFLKCYSSSLRVSAWASAVGYSSAFSIQAHRWKRRHSLAMGIVATGSGFGGIIYPIMLNQLFHIAVGFAWGVRAAAFPTPGLLIIANCVMTTCLPTAKASGLSPKPEFLMIFTDVAHVLPHRNFLVLWGVFFPYLYIQLWINEQGLSSTLGFYSISILNGSIFGRIIPNVAADYVGQFNVLVPITFFSSALMFVMFSATSVAILHGFFSAACGALFAPTIATLTRDMSEMVVRLGMAYFITVFAMLTGTPIDGALVIVLAGSAVIFLARFLLTKRKGTQCT